MLKILEERKQRKIAQLDLIRSIKKELQQEEDL
jgi:hypothetical protein